ncbi:MAG TPA: DUF4384 domain-containing protein [Bryobacteraceae bacterium]|nr:DUF4384 domain-containing protein [Bryobacteraceae bacterium]
MKIANFTPLLFAAALAAQDLTPRELFFAAPAIKAKAAVQPVRPSAPASKKQAPVEIAKAKPPSPPKQEERAPLAAPPPMPSSVRIPEVIPAAYVSSNPPLGLRYSLLLSRGTEPYREVEAGSVFQSGDRLKITVESNDEAYLYVIARGSSGMWKVLFPVNEVASGDNLIQPFRRYEVPNGGRFYFDEQAGEEKLFLVLSRKPEKDFEDLIYTVNQPAHAPTSPASAPRPAARPQKTFQMAGLIRPIDDALVGKVRNELMARDLVFEKVDDTKTAAAAPQKETAVYVVNKNAGPDGKVIVDLKLEHK